MSATKIPYRTAYSGQVRKNCPTGDPIKPIYEHVIDDFGRKILKKTGETNLFDEIQSYLEDTKIENILARCTAGDTSMLRPDGVYADVSEMPGNLIESMQRIQNLENTWKGIPNDIKAKYNFDVGQFIGQAGTEGWLRDMGLLNADAAAVKDMTTEAPAKAPKTIDAGGEVNE